MGARESHHYGNKRNTRRGGKENTGVHNLERDGERDGERASERERERGRQTDRERASERERERTWETDRERENERAREIERANERERWRERTSKRERERRPNVIIDYSIKKIRTRGRRIMCHICYCLCVMSGFLSISQYV